jgi:signal transduction histidine kinase
VIHNAIKYSPVGGPIHVRVKRAEGNLVLTEIEYDGPGIPPEDQPKLFDRFYRVDTARWRESGGAGLGLSIVKWTVEAHGGALTLESNPTEDWTVRIGLPSAPEPNIPSPGGPPHVSKLT